MEHLLVGQFDLPEIVPTRIVVKANVRNDESFVVDVLRIALKVDAHDATDELDVGRKAAERPEHGRDAEPRMVESFAQHLDLNNAVQAVVTQGVQDNLLVLVG